MSQGGAQKKEADTAVIEGYWVLDDHLRSILREVSEGKHSGLSMRKLSIATGISRTYLGRYKDREQDVCLRIMNRLANYFGVKYCIGNFDDKSGDIS